MASKLATSSLALFFTLNILFFSLVSACNNCQIPPPSPKPCPPPPPPHQPSPSTNYEKCPRDTLKIAACASVLGGLVNIVLGKPPVTPCCTLVEGLADLEAAACLCTVIKANALGLNLNIPVSLSVLLNVCKKHAAGSFQC